MKIIFEDQNLIIIDKPAGVDSQNSEQGRPSVVDWLRSKYSYAGLIHRLDLNTSGAMVCAKNPTTSEKLTKELQDGNIKRRYIAVVMGHVKLDGGEWNNPLEGKEAITKYLVSERFKNATLVEVDLETGRKHQIRRHFFENTHPLLGDHLYKKSGSHLLFHRPALHAKSIAIRGKVFEAPLPKDILELISRLRSRG